MAARSSRAGADADAESACGDLRRALVRHASARTASEAAEGSTNATNSLHSLEADMRWHLERLASPEAVDDDSTQALLVLAALADWLHSPSALERLEWTEPAEGADRSDRDDRFTPAQLVRFFYTVTNLHAGDTLQHEFEMALIELKRQLLLDRLVREDVSCETFLRQLHSFFPLVFTHSFAALSPTLPPVWLHAPSDAARVAEEEVVGELQAVAEERYDGEDGDESAEAHRTVRQYTAKYPWSDFVAKHADDYLRQALDAWQQRHAAAAAASSPAALHPSSPPPAVSKSSAASQRTPQPLTPTPSPSLAPALSSPSPVPAASIPSKVPVLQTVSISELVEATSGMKARALNHQSPLPPRTKWKWDHLVLTVREVESLLPASIASLPLLLSSTTPSECADGSDGERESLARKKQSLRAIYEQTHEEVGHFLQLRKAHLAAHASSADSLASCHSVQSSCVDGPTSKSSVREQKRRRMVACSEDLLLTQQPIPTAASDYASNIDQADSPAARDTSAAPPAAKRRRSSNQPAPAPAPASSSRPQPSAPAPAAGSKIMSFFKPAVAASVRGKK